MNSLVVDVTRDQLKKQVTDFRPGDAIRVAVRIVEGDKERIQNFEGVCIARHGAGMDETFMVRRTSYGVGMERIFPLHSPRIESITVIRHGRVRRAKLYYLRQLTGKKSRLSETRRKRLTKGAMVDVDLAQEAQKPAEVVEETPEAPVEAEAADQATEAAETEADSTQTSSESSDASAKDTAEGDDSSAS